MQFQGPSQGQAHYAPQGQGQYFGQGGRQAPAQYAPPSQGQYAPQEPPQASYPSQQGQGSYGQQQASAPPSYSPQPQGQYQAQSQGYNPVGQGSSAQGQYAGVPAQGPYKQPGSLVASPNSVEYSGQYSEKSQAYAAGPRGHAKNQEGEEESGPPRGFFYSFDYPVGIITQDQGKSLQKREEINTLYDKKKAELDQQLKHHGDYRVKRAIPSHPVYYVYY